DVSDESQYVRKSNVLYAYLDPYLLRQFSCNFAKNYMIRNLAIKFFTKSGLKMWGIPIHLRKAIVRINGTDAVESVTMVDVTSDGEVIPGTKKDIAVDFVCIAGGLYPLA